MGCVVSSAAEVAENELLARLAGTEPLSENDPYWNKLLSFNFNIDEQDRCALAGLERRHKSV